jgi:hypothetical protein
MQDPFPNKTIVRARSTAHWKDNELMFYSKLGKFVRCLLVQMSKFEM